jgi:DNA-binding NtrC family response regulator
MYQSVLIVEKDPDVLIFLTLLFEARGLRILRARSKSEALGILRRTFIPVDLVLAGLARGSAEDRIEAEDFAAQLSELRPATLLLHMNAFLDEGMIRIEAMKPADVCGFVASDRRGVLAAVMSALGEERTLVSAG